MSGRIYALMGPNGGGKSYKMKELKQQLQYSKFIEVDFSDGIRSMICNLFTGQDVAVNTLSEEYCAWKITKQGYVLPNGDIVAVDGRNMMQNLGEAVKKVYPDFWAKYCREIVLRQFDGLSKEERDNCVICFGSVRFGCEIQVVEEISIMLNMPSEYLFCNYFNFPAKEECHPSEQLGSLLTQLGYKHGDIINIEDIIE